MYMPHEATVRPVRQPAATAARAASPQYAALWRDVPGHGGERADVPPVTGTGRLRPVQTQAASL
ncbi:hypothetical protein [Streptomyces thioluteus]|uniref:hypothetical protein n=1 Tax=Streptomyces thioluteus TaxID=66431 RepID=UPI0031EB5E24